MTIRQLMIKLNQVCSKNLGRVIRALFIMIIIQTLSGAVIVLPFIRFMSQEQITAQTRGISIILVYIFTLAYLAFQFGFSIMLLRMTRNESENLGFLFLGFRRINPAIKVIFGFSLFLLASAVISRFASKALASKFFAMESLSSLWAEESQKVFFQAGLFSGLFILLSFILAVHFIFVFQLHFDNPKWSILKVFKTSALMMHGNVFRFILFLIRAGGKNLLIALVAGVIASLFPSEKSNVSILAFLFNLVYFINIYSALVRFYFTIPVLYNEILNPEIHVELVVNDDTSFTVELSESSETADKTPSVPQNQENNSENDNSN